MPTRSTFRRRGVAAALVLTALSLSGCYQNPDPTEWGSAARANFIAGCSSEVTAKGGTTTSIAIAPKERCGCIYDAIAPKGEFPLAWEKMKDYEAEQADAKPGDEPPAPPSQLTKAIEKCAPEGPGL